MIKKLYTEMLGFIAAIAIIVVAANVLTAIILKYIDVIAMVLVIIICLYIAYRLIRRLISRRSF